jgi:hypothetical protein
MTKRKLNLRNVVAIAICLAGTAIFSSCGKDDNGGSNGTKSTETTAEFDNSSFGLYKGVIVGSTGTIKIEINNGNNTAKAYLSIDGRKDTLTSGYTFSNGQAIVNATFTGAFSSFTFSVAADGKNPIIVNITIEGHSDVVVNILKETSNSAAMAYEGTSVGGNNHLGTFNIVRNNNTFSAVCKNNSDGGKAFSVNGTINSDGSFSASATVENYHPGLDVNFTISGKFDRNTVSGTWRNSWSNGTNSGTFSGQKTL